MSLLHFYKNRILITKLNKCILFIAVLFPMLSQAEESADVDNAELISAVVDNSKDAEPVNDESVTEQIIDSDKKISNIELGPIKPLSNTFRQRLKNPEEQLEEKSELISELIEYQKVIIDDAFIELHTGAGRGYPVFHIEEKGEEIYVIKKKTQWFKVLTRNGRRGWVHEDNMAKTLLSRNQFFNVANSKQSDFQKKRWEAGVMAGDFGGATTLSLYAGWNWTENIGTEISVSQALGSVSDIRYASINLTHQPFPEWRVSPYFKLGAGVIQTVPFSTIIQSEDRNDEMILVGFGLKMYASRQFFVRVEYLNHTILTSRNDNDEVEEWKLGISVFF